MRSACLLLGEKARLYFLSLPTRFLPSISDGSGSGLYAHSLCQVILAPSLLCSTPITHPTVIFSKFGNRRIRNQKDFLTLTVLEMMLQLIVISRERKKKNNCVFYLFFCVYSHMLWLDACMFCGCRGGVH